jgi:hypothetical protein
MPPGVQLLLISIKHKFIRITCGPPKLEKDLSSSNYKLSEVHINNNNKTIAYLILYLI